MDSRRTRRGMRDADLEQEGVKPELLTNGVRCQVMPEISVHKDELFLQGTEHYAKLAVARSNTRTAQSVIDQLTAGLAGHAVTREPKRGDLVHVGTAQRCRIFLCSIEGSDRPYACVSDEDQNDFLRGSPFRVVLWDTMRPIPQPVRYSRDGDIHTWTTEAEKAGEGE